MKTKGFCWMVLLAAVVLSGCSRTVTLFNGENLDGWKPVLKDASVDPATVWSAQDGVLRCEGAPFGYIRTTEAYSNYKLHVEWRWVEKPTNSGILLHITGPDQIWPQCIEAQLKYQNAGDFYAIGGTGFAELKDGLQLPKKHDSNENAPGQWNTYDILCQDDTITLSVNGLLQNAATQTTVNVGTIGLQSEGSPIEFRNITLTSLK